MVVIVVMSAPRQCSRRRPEPATEAGADGIGAADEATSNEQRGDVVDAGSERHVVAGKESHDGSSGSAPSQETVGGEDDAVTTAEQSDSKVSESSNRSRRAQTDDTSDDDSDKVSGSKQNTATATSSSKTTPRMPRAAMVPGRSRTPPRDGFVEVGCVGQQARRYFGGQPHPRRPITPAVSRPARRASRAVGTPSTTPDRRFFCEQTQTCPFLADFGQFCVCSRCRQAARQPRKTSKD